MIDQNHEPQRAGQAEAMSLRQQASALLLQAVNIHLDALEGLRKAERMYAEACALDPEREQAN